ncbi:MAG: hypothetical protein M3X11_23415, partial [Acidobacteriota bacterium]|nr:hypothetical protein [Acidobacteriota bacterium]
TDQPNASHYHAPFLNFLAHAILPLKRVIQVPGATGCILNNRLMGHNQSLAAPGNVKEKQLQEGRLQKGMPQKGMPQKGLDDTEGILIAIRFCLSCTLLWLIAVSAPTKIRAYFLCSSI